MEGSKKRHRLVPDAQTDGVFLYSIGAPQFAKVLTSLLQLKVIPQ